MVSMNILVHVLLDILEQTVNKVYIHNYFYTIILKCKTMVVCQYYMTMLHKTIIWPVYFILFSN